MTDTPLTGTKAIWMSRTVWGAAISVAAAIAGLFGHGITDADQTMLADALTQIIGIAGGLFAIWGRISATRTLA